VRTTQGKATIMPMLTLQILLAEDHAINRLSWRVKKR